MKLRIFIGLILVTSLAADGRSDGRRGNEAYAEGDFQSAAEAYQQGLSAAMDEGEPGLVFGLTNNLGAAHYRLQNATEALEIFNQAVASAPTAEARALAEYNAGNAAFKAQDLERALAHYQRALLANPSDQNAKFNYEFVRRKLQDQSGGQQQQQQQGGQQQQQQQSGEDQEQSEGEQQNQDQGEQGQDEQQPQEGDDQQDDQSGESESSQPNEPSEEDPQRQGEAPQDSRELSREEAERILQALESDEAELLREVQRMEARPRAVEKDW